MPYYYERRGSKYKVRLKDNPTHEFSKKYLTKAQALKQIQAIEINKRKRSKGGELQGGGIGDIFNKIKNTLVNLVNRSSAPTISKNLPSLYKYTSKAREMISKYGGLKVIELSVEKEPVNSKVMMLANALSGFELNSIMRKNGIDKFFHISLKEKESLISREICLNILKILNAIKFIL